MTIKVLFLAANPEDTIPINCEREYQSIVDSLKEHRLEGVFEIITRFGTGPDQLSSLIRNHQPHMLHLSMHGDQDIIMFEGQNQTGLPVLGDAVMHNIGLTCADVETVKCAVLAYCSSNSHAPILFDNVPNVVGMPDAIPNSATITYVTAFYRLVGLGKDFYAAHKGASAEVRQHPQWQMNSVPVFHGPNKQVPLLELQRNSNLIAIDKPASVNAQPVLSLESSFEHTDGAKRTSSIRKLTVPDLASLEYLVERGLLREFGYVYSEDPKNLN